MPRQTRHAFTILELVAAIIVVAIIAAILFPVFAKVRQGRNSHFSCQSNEKQLGLALQQYEQDYDAFPPCGTRKSIVNRESLAYSGVRLLGVGWGGQLYSYIKSTQAYICPTEATDDDLRRQGRISYALNSDLCRNHLKISRLEAQGHTVALFEVDNAHADVTHWDEGASSGASQFSPVGDGTAMFLDDGMKAPNVIYATGGGGGRPYSSGAWPSGRHLDGANYLFADGHVKLLKPNQVSTGNSAAHPTDAETPGQSGGAAGTANTAYAATFSTR